MRHGFCTPNTEEKLKEIVGDKERRQRLVEKAIPNIINAIKTVVCLSKDEVFRRKCLSLIKVKNEDEIPEALSEKLWSLATERLQVKLPQHERDQEVPNTESTTDKLKGWSMKHGSKESLPGQLPSDQYFDDLAGVFLGTENQHREEICLPDIEANRTTGSSQTQNQESSFEVFAEMYWNLFEETDKELNNSIGRLAQISSENDTCDNAEIRKVSGQSSPLMAITNATSPKAKLRCCENVPLHCKGNCTEKNPQPCQSTSPNDWQQNFRMAQQTKTAVMNENDFDALGTSKHEKRTNPRALHSATEDFEANNDRGFSVACDEKSTMTPAGVVPITSTPRHNKSSTTGRDLKIHCIASTKLLDEQDASCQQELSASNNLIDDFDALADLPLL